MNISKITTYTNFSKNKFSDVSLTSKQLDKMANSQSFNTSKVRSTDCCTDVNPHISNTHAGEWCW